MLRARPGGYRRRFCAYCWDPARPTLGAHDSSGGEHVSVSGEEALACGRYSSVRRRLEFAGVKRQTAFPARHEPSRNCRAPQVSPCHPFLCQARRGVWLSCCPVLVCCGRWRASEGWASPPPGCAEERCPSPLQLHTCQMLRRFTPRGASLPKSGDGAWSIRTVAFPTPPRQVPLAFPEPPLPTQA